MAKILDEAHLKARLMIAEGKADDEVARATGLAPEELGPMRGFLHSPPGLKWLKDQKGGKSKKAKNKGGGDENPTNSDGNEDDTTSSEKGLSRLQKVPVKGDHAVALKEVLLGTAGVSSPQATSLLREMERDHEQFTTNAMALYGRLQLMGLSNQRAQLAAVEWMHKVGEDKLVQRFARAVEGMPAEGELAGEKKDSFDTALERIMKVKTINSLEPKEKPMSEQIKDLVFLRESLQATLGKNDGSDSRLERLQDRVMDRLDRMDDKISSKVMRDESGVAYETVVEEEVVKDEKGNDVTRPVRTIRRPVVVQGAPAGVSNDPLDQSIARMAKLTELNMMGLMMRGMVMGGGTGSPGYITEVEPLFDEEGRPIVDGHGVQRQKTRYIPVTQQAQQVSGQAAPQFDPMALVEKHDESMLKVVEMMQNKGSDVWSSKDIVDLVKDANNKQVEVLKERVEDYRNADPLEGLANTFEALEKVGVKIGGQQTDNLEARKMDNEYLRYKIEKDDEWKKYVNEQEQKKDDKVFASQQMDRVTEVLKEGIEKVAGPLAVGFKDGYVSGARSRAAAPPQAAQPGQQQQEQEPNGPIDQETIKHMSDEDLKAYMQHVQEADGVVNLTRKFVVAEMAIRGMPAV